MNDHDISIFREESNEAVNRITDRTDFNEGYEYVFQEVKTTKRAFYNNEGDPEESQTLIEVTLVFKEAD